MSKINIRESLRRMDEDTFCKYDLLTMYDSCPLTDDNKKEIAKLLYDKEDPEVIYQKLSMYFDDDQIADIDTFADTLVTGKYERLIENCVKKLSEDYNDVHYNSTANQLEFTDGTNSYNVGVSPFDDVDTDDYELFIDYDYDCPQCFSTEQDAIDFIINYIKNKVNNIDDSEVVNCDDCMTYKVYDIVEDEGRLTAKCMNESTNDFEDIKLGKVNSQKVNELINNMLNNPNYTISDEVKKKIYDNSAPWGLAVQMTPSVDVDGTNGLLATGDFSGEASFGESVEESFEKDDRVTDGDRQGTVLDCDSQKVLVEWDYSDTDDIEWVDKSDIYTITSMKESTSMYFTCPSCENKTLVSVDTEVKIPSDVDYHDKFICDECGEEFLSEPQFNGKIKFVKDKFEESSHISGKYVYFDYDKVGKQPTSDEVVSAFNDKYYENINSVKLDRVGYNYLQKEIEYVATDDYGHKFHVVVSHAPNPVKESVSPYKKRELKKQLQDEIYNILIHEFLTKPKWGFENIKEIDDLLGLVIEVNDYKGDYDNDFVAEIRGEFTYDELEDVGDILDPIVQKYDKEAYFEPVTSGITRAYIKLSDIKESINEDTDVEDSEDGLISAEQEFDSAATSINSNKLPAVYNMVKFNPGDVVVDFGGGKFDNAVSYLKDQDVTLLVYDPYNRRAEHNKEVLKVLREHGGADAAVNSNVLNVIKEPEARNAVLQNIKKITKKGAPIYITVYEGSGKGNEGPTKSGYQLNRKTADYMDEISQVFSNVKRRGKLITAINESFSSSGLRQANIGLSYNSIRYKGYRISLLTDGSGYAIFDKHGEMEDHGFKSIKDAKSAIDEFNSIYKPVLSKGLSEASYGGAFDIEDDQYFTREDIIDFGNKVCDKLTTKYKDKFDIIDLYMEGNYLFLSVQSQQGNEADISLKIDMRKIRLPKDIMKYVDEAVYRLTTVLDDLYIAD